MKVSIKSLVEQVVKEEVSKLAEAKLDPKADKEINTLIKVANILIEKGLDSDGDPLGVLVGPAGTWEEPFTYKPIVRKGNKITFITNSPHTNGGKDQVDTEPISDSELDGTKIQLRDIIKAYKKAYKKAGIPLPTNTNEATTTMVTPDGKTLSPEQKAKMKMAKPGTNIVVKKAGELSEDADLQEKKAKEAEEEAPAENPEAPEAEAPVEDQTAGSASSELNQHISSAIDSAAKAIEASQDAKYEKVLGKVIKNLTAAQASLADVEAVENKLNEQIAKDEEKSADKFRKSLRKELKGSFKNPEHIDIILKKYDKVAKTASKENRPVQKIAEIITKHALNEGLVKKGDILDEGSKDALITQYAKAFKEANAAALAKKSTPDGGSSVFSYIKVYLKGWREADINALSKASGVEIRKWDPGVYVPRFATDGQGYRATAMAKAANEVLKKAGIDTYHVDTMD